VEVLAAATIHWSSDGWRSARDTLTQDSGFGLYFADLDTAGLPVGGEVVFTMHWSAADHWEGTDYRLTIVGTS
jgi:glucoamylase